MAYHVSKAEFARLVEKALDELPSQFAAFLEEVPVQVLDRPSPRLLRSLGLKDDELLLGLYQGASLADRSEIEGRGTPLINHILVFQEDIELVSDNEADLIREV